MTFESEETRGVFHTLPTQKQFEYCELEVYLARQGKRLHIKEVFPAEDGELKVLIRIDEKNILPVPVDS